MSPLLMWEPVELAVCRAFGLLQVSMPWPYRQTCLIFQSSAGYRMLCRWPDMVASLQAATPHLAAPCRADLGVLLMNADPTNTPAMSSGGCCQQLSTGSVVLFKPQLCKVPDAPLLRSPQNLSPPLPVEWQLEAVCACNTIAGCPEVCLVESYASKRGPCSTRDSWQPRCGTCLQQDHALDLRLRPLTQSQVGRYVFDHTDRFPPMRQMKLHASNAWRP